MTNSNVKFTNYKYTYGQEENRLTIKCDSKDQAGALKYMLETAGVNIKDSAKCTKTIQIRLPKPNVRGDM